MSNEGRATETELLKVRALGVSLAGECAFDDPPQIALVSGEFWVREEAAGIF